MVTTDFAKSGLALLMSPSGTIPRYLGIGVGSAAEDPALGSLVTPSLASRTDFSTRDISATSEVTWTWDFNSTTMSGIGLSEFGMGQSGANGVQDLWQREGFAAVNFDGSNELQIELTFQVF